MSDQHIKAAASALYQNRFSYPPAGMSAHELDATVAVHAWLNSVGLKTERVESCASVLLATPHAHLGNLALCWAEAIRAVQL